MPNAPTPPSTVDSQTKLVAYRVAGGVIAVIVTGLTAVYGSTAPWLSGVLAVVEAAVVGALGIYLGIPIESVVELALAKLTKRKPERAAELALETLQSLPPAASVTATQALFASLPPGTRERASITPSPDAGYAPTTIEFVGYDAEHGSVPPPAPVDPTGTPIIVRTSVPPAPAYDDVDAEVTRPTRPGRLR